MNLHIAHQIVNVPEWWEQSNPNLSSFKSIPAKSRGGGGVKPLLHFLFEFHECLHGLCLDELDKLVMIPFEQLCKL